MDYKFLKDILVCFLLKRQFASTHKFLVPNFLKTRWLKKNFRKTIEHAAQM